MCPSLHFSSREPLPFSNFFSSLLFKNIELTTQPTTRRTQPTKMRRYYIVSGILLVLPIIDFAAAAPALVAEKCQAGVDVALIPEDAVTVLGKRAGTEELGNLLEKFKVLDFDEGLAEVEPGAKRLKPNPNSRPSNQGPSNQGPSNQGPSNQGPSNQGPSNSPSNPGPSNPGPPSGSSNPPGSSNPGLSNQWPSGRQGPTQRG